MDVIYTNFKNPFFPSTAKVISQAYQLCGLIGMFLQLKHYSMSYVLNTLEK